MRQVALDTQRRLLRITFPYDERLVAVARTLPDRRWDGQLRAWTVPQEHLAAVWEALQPHGFALDDGARGLLDADASAPRQGGGQPAQAPSRARPAAPAGGPSAPPPPDPPESQHGADDWEHWEGLLAGPRSPDPREPRPISDRAGASAPSIERRVLPDRRVEPGARQTGVRGPSDHEEPRVQALTISQLNARVRDALRATFPTDVWLVGELLGFDRGKREGAVYFELIEKPEREDIVAKVQAVLWPDEHERLRRRLAQAPEPFELRDGLAVRVRVRVDLFVPWGRFQVSIQDIDPVYTLGELALRREAILRELASRGLLKRNQTLPLPAVPLRVALLTSASGEAARDVIHELERSGFAYEVDLYDVRVQGERLAPTVLAALRAIKARADTDRAHDVVIIARGGGSRADLAGFDDLDIALEVALLPVRVVVAIGHQRDQSVLDIIAHSVKTPTAAGALLNDQIEGFARDLVARADAIFHNAEQRLQSGADRLTRLAERITAHGRRALGSRRQRIDAAALRLARATPRMFAGLRRQLERDAQRAASGAGAELKLQRLNLSNATQVLRRIDNVLRRRRKALSGLRPQLRRLAGRAVSDPARKLALQEALWRAHDPERALARGLARVRLRDGARVIRATQLHVGELVDIEFYDGVAAARVETTTGPQQNTPEAPQRPTRRKKPAK